METIKINLNSLTEDQQSGVMELGCEFIGLNCETVLIDKYDFDYIMGGNEALNTEDILLRRLGAVKFETVEQKNTFLLSKKRGN